MPKLRKGELSDVQSRELAAATKHYRTWIHRKTMRAYLVRPYTGGFAVFVYWPVRGEFLALTFTDNFKPFTK